MKPPKMNLKEMIKQNFIVIWDTKCLRNMRKFVAGQMWATGKNVLSSYREL